MVARTLSRFQILDKVYVRSVRSSDRTTEEKRNPVGDCLPAVRQGFYTNLGLRYAHNTYIFKMGSQ